MQVRKAVIPCGGFGTRFLPVTKIVPKELLPIADRPALLYIVDEAIKSGITDILIVISEEKECIRKLFEPNEKLNERLLERGKSDLYALANEKFEANISFVYQTEQKGSGHAVYLAKEFASGEPIAVLFGDDVIYVGDGAPVTGQLIDAYMKTGKTVVGVQKTSEDVARRCGVMKIKGEEGIITEIEGIVEKPQGELPSDLVSLGRFILTPEVFDEIEKTELSADGEIYLTDAIGKVAEKSGAVACLFTGRRYDVGNKEGYLEAVVEYALRDDELGSAFANYLKGKR